MVNEFRNVVWPGWEVVRRIGSGSFGTVYEIQRDIHGDIEKAALKVIRLPRSEDELDYLRYTGLDDASITLTFQQQAGDISKEYKLMAQMRNNINVVRCDDFREVPQADGVGMDIYIKMELLTPLLKCPEKVSTEDQIIQLGKDICNALIACQEKNIIHRDIKPQNVFVSDEGDFKLGDFGIARTMDRNTHATAGIGTYSYMAPEVEKNEAYGKTVDIYSLGLMMYWLLNERRGPFMPLPPKIQKHGDEEMARQRRFSGEPIPAPANGSKELKAIVLKACAYDPNDRYQTAREMRNALNSLDSSSSAFANNATSEKNSAAEQGIINWQTSGEHKDSMGSVWGNTQQEQNVFVEEKPDLDATMGPMWQASNLHNSAAKQQETPESLDSGADDLLKDPISDKDAASKQENIIWPTPEDRKDSMGAMWGNIEDQNKAVEREIDFDATVGPAWEMSNRQGSATEQLDTDDPVLTEKTVGTEFNHAAMDAQKPQKENKQKKIGVVIGAGVAAVALIILIVMLLLKGCDNLPSASVPAVGSPETTDAHETKPQTQEWSDWADTLPEYVTAGDYEIEEKVLYSSRNLETTSSTESNTMAGWELFDTVESGEGFGVWSDWSGAEVTASDTREVETETRYRYRDKETTTGSSSTKSGWTLYDTTHVWGSYGSWSNWSETAVSKSESRKVEQKTQYRSRSITYSNGPTTWGSWSAWSFTRQSTSSLKKEESRTVWAYFYYKCPSCGAHIHTSGIYCPTSAGGCAKAYISDDAFVQVWNPTSWDDAGLKDWRGSGIYYATISGERLFQYKAGGTGTQYRYSTGTVEQVANYGNWSSWSDNAATASASLDVQKRTVYRYCDRSSVATYHFYRWGSWSNWTTDKVSATDNREVENMTYYRYRDQVKATTYYFRRWTDWTEYSDGVATPSETVEVQTKTQYRFKSKA